MMVQSWSPLVPIRDNYQSERKSFSDPGTVHYSTLLFKVQGNRSTWVNIGNILVQYVHCYTTVYCYTAVI